MRRPLFAALIFLAIGPVPGTQYRYPAIDTTQAAAQNGYYDRDGYSSYDARYNNRNDRRYDRRDYRQDRRYAQRQNQRYYNQRQYDRRQYDRRYRNHYGQRCSGSTGTILGAIAGGLLGREVAGRGDRTVGTIIGGAAGALAGRAIDRSDCRR